MLYQPIADIIPTWMDYPDTENLAIEVFMGGCSTGCEFCQNKKLATIETPSVSFEKLSNKIIYACKKYRTDKIVFVGGEPLLQVNNNFNFVQGFLNAFQDVYETIIYTGYNIEYVIKNNLRGFTFIKTGKYIHELRQESEKTKDYMILASTNQAIYDQELNLLTQNGKLNFKEI